MPTKIPVYVLPDGEMPVRRSDKSPWAVGYDVSIRAIVSPEMDGVQIHHHKVEFDLEVLYPLRPGKSVLVGFGIVLGMEENWYAELRKRSKTADAEIALLHEGVPIDPDYLGEFVCRVRNESEKDFLIGRGQKIAQLVFHGPGGDFRPELVRASSMDNFPARLLYQRLNGQSRGNGSHGSTDAIGSRDDGRNVVKNVSLPVSAKREDYHQLDWLFGRNRLPYP